MVAVTKPGRRSHSHSRSPPRSSDCAVDVVAVAKASLTKLCDEVGIPDSHGIGHMIRVLAHVERALDVADPKIAPMRAVGIRLAALLHDADDRKYFKNCPKGSYPNAKRLMEEAGAEASIVADALHMIRFVSCSANGNSVPKEASTEPELLWPRWADRIEAVGEVGIVRCWQYTLESGAQLASAATPRPKSEKEVWEQATQERFEKYQESGGSSASMMDHYYDKLLQVASPPGDIVRNRYLQEELANRAAPLVDVCLQFGATGDVPLNEDIIRAKLIQLQKDGVL